MQVERFPQCKGLDQTKSARGYVLRCRRMFVIQNSEVILASTFSTLRNASGRSSGKKQDANPDSQIRFACCVGLKNMQDIEAKVAGTLVKEGLTG